MANNRSTLNKELVRKHFQRHAHEYDNYAEVQIVMADRLLQLLTDQHPHFRCKRILEIGCGTGILTERLLRLFPDAHITAVDLSSVMIDRVQNKLGDAAGSVRCIVEDAETLTERKDLQVEPFDLIISNATFQWFHDPKQSIQAYLRELLAPEGLLAFATFGPRTFYELHASFRAAEERLDVPPLTHGPAFGSGDFWEDVFAGGQGHLIWHQEDYKVHFPGVRDFLYSVKRIGAGNAAGSAGSSRGSGKRLLAEMEAEYAKQYASDVTEGGIQATYDLIYGVFWKKER